MTPFKQRATHSVNHRCLHVQPPQPAAQPAQLTNSASRLAC